MAEQVVVNHTRKPQSEFRLTQCEVHRAKTRFFILLLLFFLNCLFCYFF